MGEYRVLHLNIDMSPNILKICNEFPIFSSLDMDSFSPLNLMLDNGRRLGKRKSEQEKSEQEMVQSTIDSKQQE